MRRACKLPPLPRGFYDDDVWQLVGPVHGTSAALIQVYVEAVGTAADWAAVGLPIRFDSAGAPLPRHHGTLSYQYVLRTPGDAARFLSCIAVDDGLAVPAVDRSPTPAALRRARPHGGGSRVAAQAVADGRDGSSGTQAAHPAQPRR